KRRYMNDYIKIINQIHFIVKTKADKLSNLIRELKKFTAKSILEKIQNEPEGRRVWMLERFKKATETHSRNKTFQFWQYGNHAEEIYSHKFMWSKLDYIHLNPVRADIVEKASYYIYSSASNYINNEGFIDVVIVNNPVVDVLKSSSMTKYNQY